MKKIIILALISISLVSCIDNDIDNKKEIKNNTVEKKIKQNTKVKLTEEDKKLLEELLSN